MVLYAVEILYSDLEQYVSKLHTQLCHIGFLN